MRTATKARRIWERHGADAHRLARYWVRRYSALDDENTARHWTLVDLDHAAADVVASAYCRYVRWLEDNVPDDPKKTVHAFIRSDARGRVTSARRKHAEYHHDALDSLPSAPGPQTAAVGRINRVADRLGNERLSAVVLVLSAAENTPTREEVGESLGVTPQYIGQCIRKLRQHPAIVDLALARALDGIQESL